MKIQENFFLENFISSEKFREEYIGKICKFSQVKNFFFFKNHVKLTTKKSLRIFEFPNFNVKIFPLREFVFDRLENPFFSIILIVFLTKISEKYFNKKFFLKIRGEKKFGNIFFNFEEKFHRTLKKEI